MIMSNSLLLVILTLISTSDAFASPKPAFPPFSTLKSSNDNHWIVLSDRQAHGVRKLVVREGTGESPCDGSMIDMKYRGSLVGEDWWTARDVADCWLSEIQGMAILTDKFVALGLDYNKVIDPAFFTEAFVQDSLGLSNKVQCKKLVMAAKRLAKIRDEFPVGTVFDEKDTFPFELGKKRIIRGMELGVKSMKVGEISKIVVRCDFAYGGEGLRKSSGIILVPPFATLCFEIELLSC
jgi:FKBP-type peptidyl-prolyl cis-trans isomerase